MKVFGYEDPELDAVKDKYKNRCSAHDGHLGFKQSGAEAAQRARGSGVVPCRIEWAI
jgi:hypothetical protein